MIQIQLLIMWADWASLHQLKFNLFCFWKFFWFLLFFELHMVTTRSNKSTNKWTYCIHILICLMWFLIVVLICISLPLVMLNIFHLIAFFWEMSVHILSPFYWFISCYFYCAMWGYTLAFTKVLTRYHIWIHPPFPHFKIRLLVFFHLSKELLGYLIYFGY
jgi:hypothetical protein